MYQCNRSQSASNAQRCPKCKPNGGSVIDPSLRAIRNFAAAAWAAETSVIDPSLRAICNRMRR